MSGARFRLVVTALLFLGWIAWLGFLAATTSRTIVVSRSQMMLATDVARVRVEMQEGRPAEVELLGFLGKPPQGDRPARGEQLERADFRSALLPFQNPLTRSGVYLAPVRLVGKDRYLLVAPPQAVDREGEAGRPLIYPEGPETETQLRDLLPEPPA